MGLYVSINISGDSHARPNSGQSQSRAAGSINAIEVRVDVLLMSRSNMSPINDD